MFGSGYRHLAARGLGFSRSQAPGDVVAVVRSLCRKGPLQPAPPARQRTAEQALGAYGKVICHEALAEGWCGWISLA